MSMRSGEMHTLVQENGPEIDLLVFGDEFYSRYETLNGYTAIHDGDLGLFCYATISQGEFVSTRTPISEEPPEGLPRHLQEAPRVVATKTRRAVAARSVPEQDLGMAHHDGAFTFGPNKGLLTGRRVSSGDIRGLTILVEFQDLPLAVSATDVSSMLNDAGFKAHGNACSVREYFQTVSSGQLDYTNLVVGPVKLSKKRSYYVQNLLVEEALALAKDLQVNGAPIDFSQFDSKGESIIDAISFMYAGPTIFDGELWPHNSVKKVKVGSYSTYFYMLTSAGTSAADLRIGTFCHENGHLLCRFPDMYDYGHRGDEGDLTDSAGIETYCLMGSGNYLGDMGTPAPVCAYLRHLVGWYTEIVSLNEGGDFEARHGEYGRIHIYRTNQVNEYFLVENRSRMGFDRFLPASGLAVYHCDYLGSNEFQQGMADRHYQCALLEADGRLDLEHNGHGDEGDLFNQVEGIALSHDTKPASTLWNGSESGLTLSEISAPGALITFKAGEGDAPNFNVAHRNPIEAGRLAMTFLPPSARNRVR